MSISMAIISQSRLMERKRSGGTTTRLKTLAKSVFGQRPTALPSSTTFVTRANELLFHSKRHFRRMLRLVDGYQRGGEISYIEVNNLTARGRRPRPSYTLT